MGRYDLDPEYDASSARRKAYSDEAEARRQRMLDVVTQGGEEADAIQRAQIASRRKEMAKMIKKQEQDKYEEDVNWGNKAMKGASMGSVGGPWGTLSGLIAGGMYGQIKGYQARKDYTKAHGGKWGHDKQAAAVVDSFFGTDLSNSSKKNPRLMTGKSFLRAIPMMDNLSNTKDAGTVAGSMKRDQNKRAMQRTDNNEFSSDYDASSNEFDTGGVSRAPDVNTSRGSGNSGYDQSIPEDSNVPESTEDPKNPGHMILKDPETGQWYGDPNDPIYQ